LLAPAKGADPLGCGILAAPSPPPANAAFLDDLVDALVADAEGFSNLAHRCTCQVQASDRTTVVRLGSLQLVLELSHPTSRRGGLSQQLLINRHLSIVPRQQGPRGRPTNGSPFSSYMIGILENDECFTKVMPARRPLHIAVALDGAGWHPAAWREAAARPAELFSARYWTDLAQRAERGLLDFVTIEDGFALQSSRYDGPDGRTDQVRGRLDAVLVAARIAPTTSHVGLLPSVTATHTEPFHISKAIATLDFVSSGRAGVRVQVSGRASEAGLFGRRPFAGIPWADREGPEGRARAAELFEELSDYVEVLRRLWDSWEDDAEIRDAATGRFVDREKLHYIDFQGRFFSVKGPSITPRPPQGQPLVTALAHSSLPYRFAARHADVVFVTPENGEDAAAILAEVRSEEAEAGRPEEEVRVFADLLVFLDDVERAARDRLGRLDELAGYESRSDAHVFLGTPRQLAALLAEWHGAGLAGFRLRPGTIPHDLDAIADGLIPALQARGLFRTSHDATTLRGRLGLPRPANRYSVA